MWTTKYEFTINRRKRYTFWAFLGDLFMITITGGLWLIWMFIRHIRNN